MSQRLSTSTIFRNLENRVSMLEDERYLSQSEIITALGYTPANVAGDAFGYVTTHTISAKMTDGAGSVDVTGSSVPGYSGVIQFRTSAGTRSGFVGFNADGGPMHYGSDTGAGHYFEGGIVSPDPSMKFGLRFNSADGIVDFDTGDYLYFSRSTDTFLFNIGGQSKAAIDGSGNFAPMGHVAPSGDGNFLLQTASGNPQIVFDAGGDRITYDRAANKFYFTIGGVNVASIDAAGNLRMKGTVTPSTTP